MDHQPTAVPLFFWGGGGLTAELGGNNSAVTPEGILRQMMNFYKPRFKEKSDAVQKM